MAYPRSKAIPNNNTAIKADYRITFNDLDQPTYPMPGDKYELYTEDSTFVARVVMVDFNTKVVYLVHIGIDTDQ